MAPDFETGGVGYFIILCSDAYCISGTLPWAGADSQKLQSCCRDWWRRMLPLMIFLFVFFLLCLLSSPTPPTRSLESIPRVLFTLLFQVLFFPLPFPLLSLFSFFVFGLNKKKKILDRRSRSFQTKLSRTVTVVVYTMPTRPRTMSARSPARACHEVATPL